MVLAMPAPVFPIVIDKRAPQLVTIAYVGPDYSSAAFLMEIRQNPGDTGTPLVSLATAAANAQGLSAVFDSAFEFVDNDGALVTAPATIVTVRLNESTTEGLALGTPRKKPTQLHYDMHINPVGGRKFVAVRGAFVIDPGTTIG